MSDEAFTSREAHDRMYQYADEVVEQRRVMVEIAEELRRAAMNAPSPSHERSRIVAEDLLRSWADRLDGGTK